MFNVMDWFDGLPDWLVVLVIFGLLLGFFCIILIPIAIYQARTPIYQGNIVSLEFQPEHLSSTGKSAFVVPDKWVVKVKDEIRTNRYSVSRDLFYTLRVGQHVIINEDYHRLI